jgi:hypothetical protein
MAENFPKTVPSSRSIYVRKDPSDETEGMSSEKTPKQRKVYVRRPLRRHGRNASRDVSDIREVNVQRHFCKNGRNLSGALSKDMEEMSPETFPIFQKDSVWSKHSEPSEGIPPETFPELRKGYVRRSCREWNE